MPLRFLKNQLERFPSLVIHLTKSLVVALLAAAVAWAKLVLHLDFESDTAGFDARTLIGLLPGKLPDHGLGEAHRGGARNEDGLYFG